MTGLLRRRAPLRCTPIDMPLFPAESRRGRFAHSAHGNRVRAMVDEDEAVGQSEPSNQDRKGSDRMSSSQGDMEKVEDKLRELEVAQATQAAMLAGAQTTQAAAHAGTWSTMLAGAAGLVVGMFLGIGLSRTARR